VILAYRLPQVFRPRPIISLVQKHESQEMTIQRITSRARVIYACVKVHELMVQIRIYDGLNKGLRKAFLRLSAVPA